MKKLLGIFPIFILTFLSFLHPIIDFSQDLGRHIKLGEIILATRHVPTVNLFSYTYSNFPFVNEDWLSEVVFYLINHIVGTQGLFLFMIFLASLSMTIVFVFVLKRTGFFVAFLSAILYLSVLLARTRLRPEIFSFFFLSLFIVILYKNREKYTRWIFLLPLIELLWVNMHIYFIIGPIVILIFLTDEVFSHYYSSEQSESRISAFETSRFVQHSRTHSKNKNYLYKTLNTKYFILFVVFLLSCLATLINPNGIIGAIYPLIVFRNYGYPIQENQSIFFLINYGEWFPWFTTFFIATISFLLLSLFSLKQTKPIYWIIGIIFTVGAFMAERNLPLFVFATYIPFTLAFSNVGKTLEKALRHPRKSYVLAGKIIVCSLTAFFVLFISIQTFGFGLRIEPSAEKGVDFLIQNNLKSPIFNNFDIGSYLDYRLYPKQKVFVDGRPEAYPTSFFQNVYIPMQQNPAIFKKEDAIYHFQTIFFSYTEQTPWAQAFLTTIVKNGQWRLVYLDTFSAIWVKSIPENAKLIKKYGLSENYYVLHPDILPNNESDLKPFAYIFDFFGWKNAEMAVFTKTLSINPDSCWALSNSISQLRQSQNPLTLIYTNRYQQFCH